MAGDVTDFGARWLADGWTLTERPPAASKSFECACTSTIVTHTTSPYSDSIFQTRSNHGRLSSSSSYHHWYVNCCSVTVTILSQNALLTLEQTGPTWASRSVRVSPMFRYILEERCEHFNRHGTVRAMEYSRDCNESQIIYQ
jgi:hypothetical protein